MGQTANQAREAEKQLFITSLPVGRHTGPSRRRRRRRFLLDWVGQASKFIVHQAPVGFAALKQAAWMCTVAFWFTVLKIRFRPLFLAPWSLTLDNQNQSHGGIKMRIWRCPPAHPLAERNLRCRLQWQSVTSSGRLLVKLRCGSNNALSEAVDGQWLALNQA